MVQGTASSVGKSTLVAGLCRLYARRGLRVAPFKAQNMSNNAAVCRGGGEIGRAQFAQAIAARVEPTVDMNPILLKPQAATSQVIVRGQVRGAMTAREYFGGQQPELWQVVVEALEHLRSEFDLVIAEGAGSPAEINLRERDLVNMRVALHANADVLLVGDIDRGGVFASLLGTWEWLTPQERARVRGFVLNKFRGDPSLLEPAPELLEQRTGIPVVGIVPFVDGLLLPEEDAANLTSHAPGQPVPASAIAEIVEIAIVRLPHIANFDEFGPLAAEPGVHVRYVTQPAELRAPDLVILPGTKATIPDLLWLAERGLADRISWLAQHSTPLFGVCGGLQMLGRRVRDPLRIESEVTEAAGLDFLPMSTELAGEKRLARTSGRFMQSAPGVWRDLADLPVAGYEIHMGRVEPALSERPLLMLADGAEGWCAAGLPVVGSQVHGLLEGAQARQALVRALAAARGFDWREKHSQNSTDAYDALADILESTLRVDLALP